MSDLLAAVRTIANAHEPIPRLVTGGQPTTPVLAAFKAAGGEVVIDLRDPMEPRPMPEPESVRSAGLEYVNVTVRSGAVDDALFTRVRETVRGLVDAGRCTLIHCGSGNRVGATLIPYLMLDRGLSEDEALEEAMRIGTRSAELVEAALAYVRSQGGGASTDASR